MVLKSETSSALVLELSLAQDQRSDAGKEHQRNTGAGTFAEEIGHLNILADCNRNQNDA